MMIMTMLSHKDIEKVLWCGEKKNVKMYHCTVTREDIYTFLMVIMNCSKE